MKNARPVRICLPAVSRNLERWIWQPFRTLGELVNKRDLKKRTKCILFVMTNNF